MERATTLGLSTATQEPMLLPVNPGSLEEGEELELPTTRSGLVFRHATTSRANSPQPTVPPAGRTVDYSREFQMRLSIL